MTYGSDGSGYPDYGPATPAEQEPYYGDVPRQQQPRYGRPEPYDPFRTRAHDQEAAERERQRQAHQQQQQQQYGHSHGRHGQPPPQPQYSQRPQQNPQQQNPQQYYGGPYEGDGYRGDAYYGNPRDAYGNSTYGNETYGDDTYGDDRYAPPGARVPGQGYRSRAADRLGATSVLEEDLQSPDPDDPDSGDPQHSGGGSKRRGNKRAVPPHVRRRRKIIWRSILAVFVLIVGYVGVTLYPYLTAPGTDRLNARVAEWGRDHHLGWAVTWLENATYKAPPTGGKLDASQLAQLQGATAATPPPKVKADLPENIVPLASGTVPGEGVWHPVTMDGAGVPIVEKAALRPDAQHTSDLAYVVWMNQKALRFNLHPGYQQPGGTWNTPDHIPADQRAGLVATWNGGFKIKPDDALAGFYAEGRTVVPLVNGKAAEVFGKDGSLKIGMWGRDETMGPAVAGVRQNLSLLVDGGKVTVGPGDGSSQQWGFTIKNSYFIARSGVGMTATGDIVYVSGRFLSVYTLAQLLRSAGATYAMELDINPDWVSFMSYAPGGDPAKPAITKLWNFTQPADRYFQPSDRDFVSVYKR